jgi:hypothetical protein
LPHDRLSPARREPTPAGRIRRPSADRRPQPAALLVGLTVSLVLVAVALGAMRATHVARGIPREAAVSKTPTGGPARVATAGDIASLERVDEIVRMQLRSAQSQLRGCSERGGISRSTASSNAWAQCARWPLAHLAMNGRTDGGILYSLAQHLPAGDCRQAVLGRSNTIRLLAADADEILRAVRDRTPSGRSATATRASSMLHLIGGLRHDWRSSSLTSCDPTL